ncbi:MAG: hypothetical protein ACOCTT_01345 [archaeon]
MADEITLNESDGNRPVAKSLDGTIAMWIHEDKNGTPYLSLQIGDMSTTVYPTNKEGETVYDGERD